MTTSIHPPGPKRKPWGHLLAFHRDPIGFLMRIARDYGDLAIPERNVSFHVASLILPLMFPLSCSRSKNPNSHET